MADDAEIIESIKRRARDFTCTSCGAQDWAIQTGNQALVAASHEGVDLTSAVPVHTVICNKCGFIRLYSALIGP